MMERPPTKTYTLREWYEKYFDNGIGYDERYDRPHVWKNKPELQKKWEDSLIVGDNDNPFCYVNCLIAQDIATDHENKNYYKNFIDNKQNYLSIIGKNRTFATATAFEKWEKEDPNLNDTITLDIKEYEFLSRQDVSRKYRAEKNGYPDTPMMHRTGCYGHVGDYIHEVEKNNMDIYNEICTPKKILDLDARQYETDFAMYSLTNSWSVGTVGQKEYKRKDYQDFMWEKNQLDQKRYDVAHKGWRSYWLTRTTNEETKKHKKPTPGWIRTTFAIFQWISDAGYKYDEKNIIHMVKSVEKFINKHLVDKECEEYKKTYMVGTDTKQFNDLLSNPYTLQQKIEIFHIDNGQTRQNGSVEGKVFRNDGTSDFKTISYLEMLNSNIVVDHYLSRKNGGKTTILNGELTTAGYNSWKNKKKADYESPEQRRKNGK